MIAANNWRTALWHLRQGGVPQMQRYLHRIRVAKLETDVSATTVAPEEGRGSPSKTLAPVDGTSATASAEIIEAQTRPALSFPALTWPDREPRFPTVRAAVILDEFSLHAFAYEWNQVILRRKDWRQQLREQPVDLLFVESAWHGNDDEWQYQLTGTSGVKPAFRELMQYCHESGIPTVFWNKEDPPHYDDFLECAGLFDVVFTTDVTMVPRYQRDLGHDRISVLPFAAQPAVHNPVRPQKGYRDRDVAFAGMYFAHKFPERRDQMDVLLGGALDASPRMRHGLDIFSRQLGGDERYQFPAELGKRVQGSLSYDRMLTAYKAYKLFLNVNSVVTSPSMCARRIFEITASGTPVVSAPSPAIRNFFGSEELPIAESRAQATDLCRAFVASPELADRTVHRAQRQVWGGHTYSHRVRDILEAAGVQRDDPTRLPTVSVLLSTNRPHHLRQAVTTVASQVGVDLQLVLVAHGFDPAAVDVNGLIEGSGLPADRCVVLRAPETMTLGACLNLAVEASDGQVLAKMDDDDFYGPRYLADQLATLAWSGADVVGKEAHHMHLAVNDAVVLRFAHREHRWTTFVMGPTIVGRREVFASVPFQERSRGEDSNFLKDVTAAGYRIYSSDRFNFLQRRTAGQHTWSLQDEHAMASGRVVTFGDGTSHVTV